jgi:hypothetical protein
VQTELVEVDVAVGVRRYFLRRKTGDCGARRIGPVGVVGDQHDLARLALFVVVRRDHHDPGQLTVGAGQRLHGEVGESEHFAQQYFELVQHRQRALSQGAAPTQLRQQRMQIRETGQRSEALVALRVVLHGARAERVETRVDRNILPTEIDEVSNDIELRNLGQRRRQVAAQRVWNSIARRHIQLRQGRTGAAWSAFIENQVHRGNFPVFVVGLAAREAVLKFRV